MKIRVFTFGSPLSVKWVKVYYLFGIPVWRKDLHKLGDRIMADFEK
jgi:hypothetical protein